jgi:lysophospholipase L1-like esterase
VLEDRCVPTFVRTIPAADGVPPPQGATNAVTAPQVRANPLAVFLGDSITWGFANGPGAPVWSAIDGGGALADYGVKGQTTQGLLSQLAMGQLSGTAPAVVVLTIGTNDLLLGQSPQAAAAGILADLGAVHLLAPKAQVLVLGVPPGHFDPRDPYRQATVQTDAIVSRD